MWFTRRCRLAALMARTRQSVFDPKAACNREAEGGIRHACKRKGREQGKLA